MRKKTVLTWGIVGILVLLCGIAIFWIEMPREDSGRVDGIEPKEGDAQGVRTRKNLDAMDIAQIKEYIVDCKKEGDWAECERAYERAIQLTQREKRLREDFINFKFGLAELYLYSLWEYGQFGGEGKIPPALTRAMKIYDEIIASHPGSQLAAEAQYRKAELFHNEFSGYWNRLHRDDAMREFQKVIDGYPGTDQARRAREKLASLQANG